MKYLIAIIILVVLFVGYILLYISNSKVEKPKDCKDIKCNGCMLECSRRKDN